MNEYNASLAKSLEEKIAFFKNASLHKEAELLQKRLDSLVKEPVESTAAATQKIQIKNPVIDIVRHNLRTKVAANTRRIPELEKKYILENTDKAQTLKDLETLQVAYIERVMKIRKANRAVAATVGDNTIGDTGPYNNEKIFSEALRLIYSQDPLWIEDFKELYFTIMPSSSITAASKSPL
ncbi:MAG: hypothetical protein FWC15_04845 [Fibromonadales bacterium]|nr:hypothetical protein [Fibromonadales bacterium]